MLFENWDKPEKEEAWESTYGEADGDVPEVPVCPTCGEPLYERNRCVFCGQPIRGSVKLDAWNKPPETGTKDCTICGAKGAMEYSRSKINGHWHGRCRVCGVKVIE